MVLAPFSLFGLFATLSNISVPLTGVNYDVVVKSFAGHITINQTYKNTESTDLECVYGFPINDQAAIVGLTVTIGNRTLTSHFKKKDEAFKEYTEALARNDDAYLLDQSDRSDDTFVLSVGRLPPGKECVVSISYVNTLESITETKLRLAIPTALYPRYDPKPAAPKGVAAPENYQDTVPYHATLTGHIQATDAILNVSSSSHPINVTTLGPKEATLTFTAPQEPLVKDLLIDIELKNNPEYYLEVEKTADGNYTAMYAFVPHFKEGPASAVQTEIIFIVDCSGSMSEEGKIDDARAAMQIFLRSIPEGSYFNFYRFGDDYESVFNQSEMYSASSFAKAKDYANTTDATLGGTEILKPLQKVFSDPVHSGFSRQVFLMTDGEVENTDDVIALVRANSANTRVFTFGLGQSPSRDLINGVAAAGHGKPEFIVHGGELGSVVARNLNRALQPAITDATVTWHGVQNVQQVPTNLPVLFKGDRQLVYAFFQLDPAADSYQYVELQRNGTKTKVPLVITVQNSNDAPFLDKLAARELIRQIENTATAPVSYDYQGSLQSRATVLSDDEIKDRITTLSVTYGVMSKYVSLVAVETRTDEERANASKPMQLREVPIQKSESPPTPVSLEMSDVSSMSFNQNQNQNQMMSGALGGLGGFIGGAAAGAVKGVFIDLQTPDDLVAHGFQVDPMYGAAIGLIKGKFQPSSTSSRAGSVSSLDDSDDSQDSEGISQNADESRVSSKKAPAAPGSSEQLNQLLALQQWDGAWNNSTDLTGLTNITQADVQSAVASSKAGLPDDVVCTILVVTYIEEKFPAQADVWQNIANKASVFLAKQTTDTVAISNVKAALLKLIKTK